MGDYDIGIQSLSPVDFNKFVNNQSLFSPENSPRTMQDEILVEKSVATSQQLSPASNHISDKPLVSEVKHGQINIVKAVSDEKSVENSDISSTLNLDTGTQLITSLVNAGQNVWAPPSHGVQEAEFNQGMFQNVNRPLNFQNFPPSTLVNAGNIMQTHVSVPPQSLNSQRRAITAQHNFPHRPMQQGMILNNAKNYPQWSTAHTQAQATISPWAQIQQHHNQRRSVPNMNIQALAQLKKPSFPQNLQYNSQINGQMSMFAPSKFRRSTSFPGQMHQATFTKPNLEYNGMEDLHKENFLTYKVCMDNSI